MSDNETQDKDSIARQLGWESYDAAPHPVQNVIDDGRDVDITEPFAPLRRDG